MELHCPVVVFDKDGKIFIAKRSMDRKILPGKWEFGAAKPDGETGIEYKIVKEYYDDFGFTIKLFKDNLGNPIPVSTYEVMRDGELHKGVIFAAKLISNKTSTTMGAKHSDKMWASIATIDGLPDDECVPALKSAAIRAYSMFILMNR